MIGVSPVPAPAADGLVTGARVDVRRRALQADKIWVDKHREKTN